MTIKTTNPKDNLPPTNASNPKLVQLALSGIVPMEALSMRDSIDVDFTPPQKPPPKLPTAQSQTQISVWEFHDDLTDW